MKMELETKTENAESKTVLVFLQDKIYGNVLYYPDNLPSKAIVSIAGRKTLEWKHIQLLESTGCYDIVIENRY